jgi:hypothetical protein
MAEIFLRISKKQTPGNLPSKICAKDDRRNSFLVTLNLQINYVINNTLLIKEKGHADCRSLRTLILDLHHFTCYFKEVTIFIKETTLFWNRSPYHFTY